MIRNLFGGATKCRTIDKLDIFGDGSCKALYRFDGNANDESGNYHGTETDATYGGGVYERGAVFNGVSNSYVSYPFNYEMFSGDFTISLFAKGTSSDGYLFSALPTVNNPQQIAFYISSGGINTSMNVANTYYKVTSSLGNLATEFTNIVMTVSGTTLKQYVNGVETGSITIPSHILTTLVNYTSGASFYNGSIIARWTGSVDQVRIFNRAITAQEVATLYAECEPTSIVDNINPFEDGSLKALYKFDGDATDATGVYNGTATNVTYASGKFGNCAVFNGTNSKVDFTAISTAKAISFWTNRAIVNSVSYKNVFASQSVSKRISIGNVSSYVTDESLSIADGTSGGTGSVAYILNQFNDSTWKHITISYIADNNFKITVNGVYMTVNYYGTVTNIIQAFNRIGADSVNGGTFDASIDQVRIFNKALTPMEVASLYNETTPLEEPLYALVDPFKDGSGKALYRLEGNALDESGNYNGTPTSVTYGSGRFGRCAVFNGSTSSILIGDVARTQTLAISALVNVTLNRAHSVVSYADQTFYHGFIFQINTSNQLQFYITGSAGQASYLAITTATLTSGFNHVCVSYANRAMSLYVNGVKQDFTSTVDFVWNVTMNAYIGRGYANIMLGSIDQVRFFNRALTQTEVTALYNEI